VLCYLSVSYFFVPHFGMSAWGLKCSEPMGPNSDIVQWRMCENRWQMGWRI